MFSTAAFVGAVRAECFWAWLVGWSSCSECSLILSGVSGRILDNVSGGAAGRGAAFTRCGRIQVALLGQVPSGALGLASVESSVRVFACAVVVASVIPLLVLSIVLAMVVAARSVLVNIASQCLAARSWQLGEGTVLRQVRVVVVAQVVTLVVAQVGVSTGAVLVTAILPGLSSHVLSTLVRARGLVAARSSSVVHETCSALSRNHEDISLLLVGPSVGGRAAGVEEGWSAALGGMLVETCGLGRNHDPTGAGTALAH